MWIIRCRKLRLSKIKQLYCRPIHLQINSWFIYMSPSQISYQLFVLQVCSILSPAFIFYLNGSFRRSFYYFGTRAQHFYSFRWSISFSVHLYARSSNCLALLHIYNNQQQQKRIKGQFWSWNIYKQANVSPEKKEKKN